MCAQQPGCAMPSREAGTVFHLASQVAVTTSLDDPAEDFAINAARHARAARNVAAPAAAPAALIFTSTNKVYGAIDDIDLVERDSRYEPAGALAGIGIAETRPLQFHSPYGCSKGAADQYVLDYARSYGLPTAVLRMSCIYGPHQHGTEDQGWVAHFLIRAMQGQDDHDLRRRQAGARPAVRRRSRPRADCWPSSHMPEIAGQAFNIGGGPDNTVSLLELIAQIAALHGGPPEVEFGAWRVGDQRWYVSDSAKFCRATGWRPQVGVAEGIRLLYDWLLASAGATAAALQAAQ